MDFVGFSREKQMKMGLEKKKLPYSFIVHLLTLLLVLYFMSNPLATTTMATEEASPRGSTLPPSLVGDSDQI